MPKPKLKVVEIDLDPDNISHDGVIITRKDLGVELRIRTWNDQDVPEQMVWHGDLAINTDNATKFIDLRFKDTITLSGIELKYSHKGEIVTAHRTIPKGDIIKAAVISVGPTGKMDLKFKDGFVACGVNSSDIA